MPEGEHAFEGVELILTILKPNINIRQVILKRRNKRGAGRQKKSHGNVNGRVKAQRALHVEGLAHQCVRFGLAGVDYVPRVYE